MTANDNIRHYIGDLEATEDIDLVFKHIYDLMLANGGEGTGLNADMVDGYHASDFAPASILDEIDKGIQEIHIGDQKFSGQEVYINLLAQSIRFDSDTEFANLNLKDVLTDINVENSIARRLYELEMAQQNLGSLELLNDSTLSCRLKQLLSKNMQCVDTGVGTGCERTECYLDANSVNGVAIQVVSQNTYDTEISAELKADPTNVFIINDNIDSSQYSPDNYAPPSLLRANANLEFRLNSETLNIEYSIDGGCTWNVALPLIGDSTNKGVLYPSWFNDIRARINTDKANNANLENQAYYPFLLNTTANNNALNKTWVDGLKFDEDHTISLSANPLNGTLDISTALGEYLSNWIYDNTNDVATILNVPNENLIEYIENKIQTISDSGSGSALNYPSEKAIISYVNPIKTTLDSLNTTTNNIKTYINTSSENTYTTMAEIRSAGLRPFEHRSEHNSIVYTDAVSGINNGTPDTSVEIMDWKPGSNDSESICLGFNKKNGICFVRMYFRVSLYKNTVNQGNDAYEVPIFNFPSGYEPEVSGYLPNPLCNHPSNRNAGLLYYIVRKSNDKYQLRLHWQNTDRVYTSSAKDIPIGFTWTYHAKNSTIAN